MLSNFKTFSYNGQVINQRADGFVNLTQMCEANGKKIGHYLSLKGTKAYIQAMVNDTAFTMSDIVEVTKGGDPSLQGTWGHPELAIHLAQWISPKFHRWCNAHIFMLMSNGSTSLNIDPLEEMRLKIELAKLERDKVDIEHRTIALRHTIVATCPEPIQQKILGYQTVKEVERVEVVVDRVSKKSYDGVGITYIRQSLGFDSNKEAWAWLERNGYGKNSGVWQKQLSAVEHEKVTREVFEEIKQAYKDDDFRQRYICENDTLDFFNS